MNDIANYDRQRAAEELERQMGRRLQTSHIVRCASNVMDDEDWAMEYQCIRYGNVWRLVLSPEEGSLEEGVLAFQGIIYKKDLAPFNTKATFNKANAARFLRQSLTLCGLKTPLFEKSVQAVLGIHALMARSVPQDELEACSMVSVDEDEESLLHMGNRYLTPKKEAGGYTVLPLPDDIDPQGHLARAAGNQFVYTDDNHVRFYERRRVPGSDDQRFEECSPVIFRAGDLVEAQVTFIVVNLREGRKKTAMVLRSLSLLDGSITQRSMVAQMLQREETAVKAGPIVSLKRRVGYSEEGTSHEGNDSNEDVVRPIIKRRVGYVYENISDATQQLARMEIETPEPQEVDLD